VSRTSSARRMRWAAWQLALLVASGAAPPHPPSIVRGALALGKVSSSSIDVRRERLVLDGAVGSAPVEASRGAPKPSVPAPPPGVVPGCRRW